MNPEIIGIGTNGKLIVYESTIELKREGMWDRMLGLYGSKEIAISSITSIQFKKPGFLTNGFIQFAFSGSSENKGGGVFEAAKDENTVVFTNEHLAVFEKIKNIINRKREELKFASNNNTNENSNLTLDDLGKLAELNQKGLISDEEFALVKKRILNI
jgi:hypothetical protein